MAFRIFRPLLLRTSYRQFSTARIYRKQETAPDLYAALGVSRVATNDQIRMAYFKKAKLYHPDNNRTEEGKWMFYLVSEAYEVLTDDKKRKMYDECGAIGYTYGGRGSGPARERGATECSGEELFEKIFGQASKYSRCDRINIPGGCVSVR